MEFFEELLLISIPLSDGYLLELPLHISIPFIIICSYLSYFITKNILIKTLNKIIIKTSTNIDDILVEKSVFNNLAYIAPLLILYFFSYLIPQGEEILHRILISLIILLFIMMLGSFLEVINELYKRSGLAEHLHIKSYIQIIKLVMYI